MHVFFQHVIKLLFSRYCLYGRWKNHSYNLHSKLIDAKAKTIKKAKYIAKLVKFSCSCIRDVVFIIFVFDDRIIYL